MAACQAVTASGCDPDGTPKHTVCRAEATDAVPVPVGGVLGGPRVVEVELCPDHAALFHPHPPVWVR